ncbi:MAG: beta-lactamase family protein [Planctomycetes bacterium]|nr:beta-lactamase family protein [Planctomycetota bacterium]
MFEAGSVTKSFTCVCIALLLDQGKIAADDDIRKYLPEVPRYDPPITIRHLVRCECGLPDYFHLMRWLRFWEKLRDKWRRRKWMVRFVLLALARWWRQADRCRDGGRSASHSRARVAN